MDTSIEREFCNRNKSAITLQELLDIRPLIDPTSRYSLCDIPLRNIYKSEKQIRSRKQMKLLSSQKERGQFHFSFTSSSIYQLCQMVSGAKFELQANDDTCVHGTLKVGSCKANGYINVAPDLKKFVLRIESVNNNEGI